MQFIETLSIRTRPRSTLNISPTVQDRLAAFETGDGLLTAFIRHTSASLTIQENADPDVQADLLDALDRLAPAGPHYRHSVEGPDDMPAHIKSVLTQTSIAIPVLTRGFGRALAEWARGDITTKNTTRAGSYRVDMLPDSLARKLGFANAEGMARWNDDDRRTQAQVLARIDRAIAADRHDVVGEA